MPRHGEKKFLTYEQIGLLGERLTELADFLASVAEEGKADKRDGIKTTHFTSGVNGIEMLAKLVGAIHAAHSQEQLKHSLTHEKLIALVEQEPFDAAVRKVRKSQSGNKKKND